MLFLGLGLLELIFFGVFFLLLIVGTAFDRQGKEEPKWYIFGVGLIAIVAWFWKDWTFGSVWEFVSTLKFWAPVGAYLLAGLVYSLLEFFLDVRRSARFYADAWKTMLNQSEWVNVYDVVQDANDPSGEVLVQRKVMGPDGRQKNETRARLYSEVYSEVKEKGAKSRLFNDALKYSKTFTDSYRFKDRIVEIQLNADDKITVEPRVNKIQLAEHIGAWTFLWPAYAISLIIGDLLTEVFNILADILANISGRLVRLSFSNVFKF